MIAMMTTIIYIVNFTMKCSRQYSIIHTHIERFKAYVKHELKSIKIPYITNQSIYKSGVFSLSEYFHIIITKMIMIIIKNLDKIIVIIVV